MGRAQSDVDVDDAPYKLIIIIIISETVVVLEPVSLTQCHGERNLKYIFRILFFVCLMERVFHESKCK